MIRTQISLTEQQMRRLRDTARRRGLSIAAVVRDAVDEHLTADPDDYDRRARHALGAVGAFHGGAHDVAVDHDAYLFDDPPADAPADPTTTGSA